MVTRFTLLKELSAIVPDDVLVLTSIGNNSGFWGQLKDREANLFHLTMGMCSSTALGLSLALPNRKIVAVDSDGNLTLNLGVLGTIANEAPKNLTIVAHGQPELSRQQQACAGHADGDRWQDGSRSRRQGLRHRERLHDRRCRCVSRKDSKRASERRSALYPRPRRAAR